MSRAQVTWFFAIIYSILCHFIVVTVSLAFAQSDGYLFLTIYVTLSAVWFFRHLETASAWSFTRVITMAFFASGIGLMMLVPTFVCFVFLSMAYVLASYHALSAEDGLLQKTITPWF
jgi:hypothetical protein